MCRWPLVVLLLCIVGLVAFAAPVVAVGNLFLVGGAGRWPEAPEVQAGEACDGTVGECSALVGRAGPFSERALQAGPVAIGDLTRLGGGRSSWRSQTGHQVSISSSEALVKSKRS